MADPLRILAVLDRPLPLIGGAEISLAVLFGQLQREYGHRCEIVGMSAARARARAYGVSIHTADDLEQIVAQCRVLRPDVLMSTRDGAVLAGAIGERFGIPTVAWMSSFEFCPPSAAERRQWGVNEDRHYLSDEECARVLHGADALLSNSVFMQARLARQAGIRSTVVHPTFEPADFMVDGATTDRQRYVTGVCGYAYKGADVFLALASRLPDVPFMLVGRVVEPWRTRALSLPNVRLRPFGPAHEFLAETRVLLVPSQWPEPFGRIAVEGMANGIPTLASRSGGLTEVCGPRLSVRAFRNPEAWRAALTRVLRSPEYARALGEEGRRRARRFVGNRSVAAVDRVCRRLARRHPVRWPAPHRVLLSGSRAARSAFAMVNQQWSQAAATGGIRLESREPESADAMIADVQIRHDFSRKFSNWPPPAAGYLVAARTWDFGPYPQTWVDEILANYDQLWVPTRWIRDQAIASGIPAARVVVIPFGVDRDVFAARGARWRRAAAAPFTFLFVGALVRRKGADTLLRAYLNAFRAGDPVRLVVKTHPDDVFYAGESLREEFANAAANADAPEIVVIDRFLTPRRLAALYRAADVSVFPYRAEGFCLPILESMSCGTPAIVPDFGAARDFCTSRTSFLVPTRRIQVAVNRRFAFNTLGFEEDVQAVDFCEIDTMTLAGILQTAVETTPHALRAKSRAGERAAERFTWTRSAEQVARAVRHVMRSRVPVRLARAREAATHHQRVLEVARELYLK